jgi:chaperonin GroES
MITIMGNTNKFEPLNDKIVILPYDDKKTTSAGLFVPDMAQGHQNRGEVIAVGPGKYLQNGDRATMAVSTGDTVWYNAVAGFKVTKDGVDYYVLSEDHVYVIEKD